MMKAPLRPRLLSTVYLYFTYYCISILWHLVQVLNIINFRPPPPKQVCRGAPPPRETAVSRPQKCAPPSCIFFFGAAKAARPVRAPCAPRAPEWGALPALALTPQNP